MIGHAAPPARLARRPGWRFDGAGFLCKVGAGESLGAIVSIGGFWSRASWSAAQAAVVRRRLPPCKRQEGMCFMSNRESGTVKWFDNAKGYGFISRASGQEDVFVHFRQIRGEGYRTLQEGQQVQFSVVQGQKGLQAEDVAVVT
jgi:CspA family cold shock protein